jgi:hypothetical protein
MRMSPRMKNMRHEIGLTDDEWTPRYTTCLKCDRKSDFTSNKKGNCAWHKGVVSYPCIVTRTSLFCRRDCPYSKQNG